MEPALKILVRSPNWIGDQVMARSFYQRLRESYPTAHLTLLCPKPLDELPFSAYFNEVMSVPKSELKTLALARRLKKERFALSVSLTASWSTSLLLWLARIPQRVGFSEGGSGVILTDFLQWQGVRSGRHKSELYLDLLRFLKAGPASLSTETPLESQKENWIVIAPGASISLREWPELPKAVAGFTRAHPEFEVVLVGTAKEKKWEGLFARQGVKFTSFIGKTALLDLLSLFQKARLCVAMDSGTAHLSATLAGTATVVVFGPGDPTYIRPVGKVVALHREGLACRPCEKPYCLAPFGYQACLRQIPEERFLAAAREALSL